jgi:hypothetical protein
VNTGETPHIVNTWVALARHKYFSKPSRAIPTAYFDGVLGHSVAVTDTAANRFPTELIAAYPDAKVVLNTRSNLDAWNASVTTNIVGVNEDRLKWLMWYVHLYSTCLRDAIDVSLC